MATTCKKGIVDVGAKVVLKIKNKELEYHIVGEWEADPVAKKIVQHIKDLESEEYQRFLKTFLNKQEPENKKLRSQLK